MKTSAVSGGNAYFRRFLVKTSDDFSVVDTSTRNNTPSDTSVATVSVWEIARKYAQGRLSLPSHPSTLIPPVRQDSGIASLSLTETDALGAEKLELFHKDPFDRMLIAQVLMGGLVIITSDRDFEPYPVRVIW